MFLPHGIRYSIPQKGGARIFSANSIMDQRDDPSSRVLVETFPDDPAQIPGSLLPNPGEGGPVGDAPTLIGRPNRPSYPTRPSSPSVSPTKPPNAIQPLPGSNVGAGTARVRFMNVTHGYPSFRILVDGQREVGLLSAMSISSAKRVSAGNRTVSVIGQDGYTYLQQPMSFSPGAAYILVVNNRVGGLRLDLVRDSG